MENVKKLPEFLILFGHRQQHGKDTCCDILEEYCLDQNLSFHRSYFAKTLKLQVAQRYNLDFERMGDDAYKNWCPPWITPKECTINYKFVESTNREEKKALINGQWYKVIRFDGGYNENVVIYLKPRSVRDILIEEGCKARSLWEECWAVATYKEILDSGCEIGFISDYRFPNEKKCFDATVKEFIKDGNYSGSPKLYTVLVHRDGGVFKDDGADNELPDLDAEEGFWDFIVYNNIENGDWKSNIQDQIVKIIKDIRSR